MIFMSSSTRILILWSKICIAIEITRQIYSAHISIAVQATTWWQRLENIDKLWKWLNVYVNSEVTSVL